MRIGLIARMDNTGLGVQSQEFYNHIPCKVLAIDSSALGNYPVLKPYPERFPGAMIHKLQRGKHITEAEIQEFIKDIDVLFCMETPYNYRFFSACAEKGVKTILQLNYEFLEYPNEHIPNPDLFAAPSLWNFDDVPKNKLYLPVPVNTNRFNPVRSERTFIHIAGRPAIHDRNGTQVLLNALQHVTEKIKVIIRAPQTLNARSPRKNVELIVDNKCRHNYWDGYTGGVLVMPRKYGGLCLPVNEALAAEMPVIAPDISPNNLWLPKEWLTKAHMSLKLHARKPIDVYEPDPRALAAKIDQFCNPDFYHESVEKAKALKETISWDNLLPLYHQTFEKLCLSRS